MFVELLAENGFPQKMESWIAIVQFCYTFWRVHFMISLAANKYFFSQALTVFEETSWVHSFWIQDRGVASLLLSQTHTYLHILLHTFCLETPMSFSLWPCWSQCQHRYGLQRGPELEANLQWWLTIESKMYLPTFIIHLLSILLGQFCKG